MMALAGKGLLCDAGFALESMPAPDDAEVVAEVVAEVCEELDEPVDVAVEEAEEEEDVASELVLLSTTHTKLRQVYPNGQQLLVPQLGRVSFNLVVWTTPSGFVLTFILLVLQGMG